MTYHEYREAVERGHRRDRWQLRAAVALLVAAPWLAHVLGGLY